VRTLVNGGVDVCFSNPGTSEMHFVAALDRVEGMRCVLALFEGVATGAADGYARMAEKPAATLLHLGPGLANGLANLHNASKASTPVVNIVGDHATYHRQYDAPLTSDIETAAQPFSGWVRTSPDATRVAADGAAAIAAAMSAGQVRPDPAGRHCLDEAPARRRAGNPAADGVRTRRETRACCARRAGMLLLTACVRARRASARGAHRGKFGAK
jgi:glyoxylate carboligase